MTLRLRYAFLGSLAGFAAAAWAVWASERAPRQLHVQRGHDPLSDAGIVDAMLRYTRPIPPGYLF